MIFVSSSALGMNMVDSYINRKHGREEVTYGHESVKKILSTTYGVIVYQEQVMQIAPGTFGFLSWPSRYLAESNGERRKKNGKSEVYICRRSS